MISAAGPCVLRTVVLGSAVLIGTACFDERTRPDPVEPPPAQLLVEVLEPFQNDTVIAGRDISIRVSARDLGGSNLAGVGFVVRHATVVLDSVAVSFTPKAEHVGVFPFRVPAQLPTNTRLDVFGFARGPGTQSRISTARSVVAVQCDPTRPGCN